MSTLEGILNFKEPLAIGQTIMAPALGDGCADDGPAIQARLDLLDRTGAMSTGKCQQTGNGPTWAPYYSGLYFPPGRYRITQPLVIPDAKGFRLFGAAGAAGRANSFGAPIGAMIEQSTDDTPIIIIGRPIGATERKFIYGWTIEHLGFQWANQQDAPDGWAFREPGEAPPPGYDDPGAVAILFAGPSDENGSPIQGSVYHGLIRDCDFRKGWRGIALDDTHLAATGPWNTHIEHCRFSSFRGAAISLVGAPGIPDGMPNNSIVSTFVENYSKAEPDVHKNIEEQIRLTAQNGMRMVGLDLEGSKFRVMRLVDCTLAMTATHIEHVEIRNEQYPRMFYFGGGRYFIHGMTVDGAMSAKDPQGNTGHSTIFSGDENTELVIGGIRAKPYPYAVPGIEDAPGFIPLNGKCQLVNGAGPAGTENPPAYYFLDRPDMPVHSAANRALWDAATPGDDTYEPLYSWRNGATPIPMSGVVRAPVSKAVWSPGSTSNVGPSASQTYIVDVKGAHPGDIVRLGAPADLDAGLIFSGVATVPDKVEIRLFNSATAAATLPDSEWTIEVGGGPDSGDPQEL